MMKKTMAFVVAAAALGFGSVVSVHAASSVASGKALVEKAACAACHGANMNTPISPEYPKLAGQYADYVYNALRAYQNEASLVFGRSNVIMKSQMMSNPAITGQDGKPRPFTARELKDIAAYIESLPGDLVTRK